ncbi:D-mannose-1-phosphate guanyltransferase [Leptospira yasudae]|uniref:sugar phosphate nucleotidyltransferase n=1 Tax=Leptospira yasudae TaxID=2202201 RepID=UPI000E59F508|nr:sugar phosphate nucleotidyltransferase [Leptospira yasudae]RHX91183.1 D-mannose-1-phosphate guanyltransferase [Leptospira yasudae]
MKIDIPLFILAGGFGTRLQSVVSDVPKPLAPIEKKPFLQYLLERWIEQGVSNFIFLLHHKAELIVQFVQEFQKTSQAAFDFSIVREAVPLGTGGSVANAVRVLGLSTDFFVSNADTWLGPNTIQRMNHLPDCGIGIVKVKNTSRYGSVELRNEKIVKFREKTLSSGSDWINAGIYKLNSKIFENWNGQPFSMESELFPKLIAINGLNAIKLENEFIDIGIPEDYAQFQKWIQSNKDFSL